MATIRCPTKTFHNIRAIVFDKDGTLADSEAFLRSLGQRRSRLIDAQVPGVQEPLLMAFGVETNQINPNGLMAVGTRQENEVAAAAYVAETGRNWIEALTLVKSAFAEADKYLQRKAEQTALFAGAAEMLSQISSTGVKLAILSSDTPENVEEFVQTYQLAPYLHYFTGVSDGPGKPHPSLLRHVCQTLQILPQETIVVGDSQADIQLAQAAGAAGCIGVTWGWTDAVNLNEADAVIGQFDQLQVIP
ncbi:HAD family hydrolase [Oculatella sp. LEGE 06141]|uniref:HAD family hydrolase n=1 Tax=Oculatella sp. LEGE 06141 TaxID=1828648 RepID=UPI001882A735|nr:HAD family hydrolase [Oculatella sp. LEGE 06141]MBE9177151.1 HAD family hydrolase [Oculatella sp. LEGE 06141]